MCSAQSQYKQLILDIRTEKALNQPRLRNREGTAQPIKKRCGPTNTVGVSPTLAFSDSTFLSRSVFECFIWH